jgi:hypothetical protein
MNNINNFINKYNSYFLLFFLISISFLAILIYVSNGQNLLYGDALSRLNISRKVFDNLTPGLAQLGNVWLPLPPLNEKWNDEKIYKYFDLTVEDIKLINCTEIVGFKNSVQ